MSNQPSHTNGDIPDATATDLFARGRQAESEGAFERARDLYRDAIARRADHADWYYRLGCVCLKSSRFEEARAAFTAGLERRPADAKMLTNLGAALDRLGRTGDALATYQRATFLEDAPAAAYHNLGALCAECGRADDAVRAFTEAVRKQPDADGYCSLGMVLLAQDDLVRALDNFERAVSCDGSFTRGHYYAAVCLLRRGRYAEALARFDLALGQEPALVRAHFHRGVCLHKLERFGWRRQFILLSLCCCSGIYQKKF